MPFLPPNQQCQNTVVYPNALKLAKVVPVYKKVDKNLLSNCQPISLLGETYVFSFVPHTHTHNHVTALLDFVQDNPGELAPER